jgi:hypothetical protein
MWLGKSRQLWGGNHIMSNKIRIIGVGLAAMAGILLVSGMAWAQALKTPIEGSWRNCQLIGEPDKDWRDEDGVRHVRGQKGRCDHVGDDVFGRRSRGELFVEDRDVDGAAGTYFAHGTNTFGGQILGEFVSATGHFTVEGTRIEGVWTFTEEDSGISRTAVCSSSQGPGVAVTSGRIRGSSSTHQDSGEGIGFGASRPAPDMNSR